MERPPSKPTAAGPYRTPFKKDTESAESVLDAIDATIDEALSYVDDDAKRERLKRALAGMLVAYTAAVRREEEDACMEAANEAVQPHNYVFQSNWDVWEMTG